MRAPQDVRLRLLRTALVLGAVALGVLLLGPWGSQLNRLTVGLYVFFRTDVPIAPDWALPEHYGALLNVVLFVPVGVGLALISRWSWSRIAVVATIGSAVVELSQAAIVSRDSSVVDVVTNGLGALLGAVAVMVVRRLRARH